MNSQPSTHCPACGEPVDIDWKICPACEAPLAAPACPGCGQSVRPHWKRCPKCELRLLCPTCGRRLSGLHGRCPDCSPPPPESARQAPGLVVEAVCGMEFVRVPGGEFLMGDVFGEGTDTELPVHTVALDDFLLGRYPVTQEQWNRVMPENPSCFRGNRRPVENVGCADTAAFISALEAKGAGRFALPSEAQWEYAARSGGRRERYAGGDRIEALAWYGENSGGHTRAVGGRRPNGLGLYDMSGNVWEWCRDFYLPDAYTIHAEKNPLIEEPAEDRVIRGGSWNLDAWSARCARRSSLRVDDRGPGVGFRLVMLEDRDAPAL